MEPIIFGIGFLVVFGFILMACQSVDTRNFQEKFASMGDLRGKSSEEIIAKMGKPQSALRLPDGNFLVEWVSGDYSIALIFNAQKNCLGVYGELMSSPQYQGGVGVGVPIDF